jgi:P4 family phage/plasmid primase-like protien
VTQSLPTADSIASAADPYDAPPVDRAADLLAAALDYAGRGWHVIPLHNPTDAGCSCGGFRCKVGKHPRTQHGVTDATRDEAAIRAWWSTWPLANIGIATGIASGLVVLDVDARNGGTESFARLVQEYGEIGRTRLVFTSGGGFHVYLAHPRDREIACRVGLPGYPGLDVKGDGGYVIAPPSLHVSGTFYRTRPGEEAAPIAPAPAWLLDLAAADVRGARVAVAWTGAATLSERARLVIDTNPRARARFDRNAEALLDPSPSGVDLALTSTISGLGIDGDSDLAAAISESRARANLPPPSASYLRATIGRAKTNAPRGDRDEPGRPDPTAALGCDAQEPAQPRRGAPPKSRKARPTLSRLTNADEPTPGGSKMPDALDLATDATAKPLAKGGAFEDDTDDGLAERFVRLYGGDLVRVPKRKRWFVWDGRRYRLDDDDAMARAKVRESVRSLFREAADADADEAKRLGRMAVKGRSVSRLRAALSIAEADARVTAEPSDFDTDPWAFNALNGTIDLRTGDLRPHRKADRLTLCAPVAYDAKAKAPLWHAFLAHVQPDAGMRHYLQQAVGYSLTGSTVEECMWILVGGGQNGKSTFLETIRGAFGRDYAAELNAGTLMIRRDNVDEEMEVLLAPFDGPRLLSSIELRDGQRLHEQNVKRVTSGEPIRVRHRYSDSYEIVPTGKVWMGTNHRPSVTGDDDGIWRRLRLVPFEVQIPEADRDLHLREKLRDELPGVLAWAIAGCLDWQRNGFTVPDVVRNATRDYRSSEDVVGAFLDECTELGRALWCSSKDLHAALVKWCKANGEIAPTPKALGDRLVRRGFPKRKVGDVRGFEGLQLREPFRSTNRDDWADR